MGQQFAARSDVLQVLLGRLSPGSPRTQGVIGEQTLRQILDRWADRGLIVRDRLLGFTWAAPTSRALHLVGLDVPAWSFVVPRLNHVHAVGIVRLALEPTIPAGGRWISERELRADGAKRLVPDAAIELPEDPDAETGRGLVGEAVDRLPDRIAIEVELTRKAKVKLREAWTRPRHAMWQRTCYYAPPKVASYLVGQLERVQPRHPVRVLALPQVPGTSYGGAA